MSALPASKLSNALASHQRSLAQAKAEVLRAAPMGVVPSAYMAATRTLKRDLSQALEDFTNKTGQKIVAIHVSPNDVGYSLLELHIKG